MVLHASPVQVSWGPNARLCQSNCSTGEDSRTRLEGRRSVTPVEGVSTDGTHRLAAATLAAVARALFLLRRPPPMPEGCQAKAKSFLLIRPEGLGDIILTLPAIAYLRRLNPVARVSMAVRPAFVKFVEDIGVVDEVIRLDYPKRSTFRVRELGTFVRQVAKLRSRFDVAFDFRGDPRNAILGAWSARIVAGRAAAGTEFLLSAICESDFLTSVPQTNLSIASLGSKDFQDVRDYESGYAYRIPEQAASRVDSLLSGCRNFIVIHAGASCPSNRWASANWRALILHLLERGKTVVLTGAGAEDRRQMEEVLAGVDEQQNLLNLVGRTTCTELAAAVERAAAIVSPDTGTAHVAHARGIPAVTLYGSDSELRWGHRTDITRSVSVKLPCRPCFSYACKRTDFPGECMARIGVGQVISALDSLLTNVAEARKSGSAARSAAL